MSNDHQDLSRESDFDDAYWATVDREKARDRCREPEPHEIAEREERELAEANDDAALDAECERSLKNAVAYAAHFQKFLDYLVPPSQ